MKKPILITVIAAILLSVFMYSNDSNTKEQKKMEPQPQASKQIDDLITREVLFGNPDRMMVRLNSTGEYISYVAPKDGVLNVWIAKIDDVNNPKVITNDTSRGIRSYFWTYDNQHIIYAQDTKGDENWHLYSVNIDTLETKDLTPKEKARATVIQLSRSKPNEILIGMNDRNPEVFDIYVVDINTGETRLVLENNNNYSSFTADDDYNIRFAYKLNPDGEGQLYNFENNDLSQPKLFKSIKQEDLLTTYASHITKDGNYLYMVDSTDANTAALTKTDLQSMETSVVYKDEKADISDLLLNPQTKEVEAVSVTYFKDEQHIIDSTITPHLEKLKTIEQGQADVISRTYADDKWIVAYQRDNGPIKYYIYNKNSSEGKFLFTSSKSQEDKPFTSMHPVLIKARDGVDMVSYLSLPRWLDDGNGKPKEPLPMILYVHGGPNARDEWGYNSTHQWLANRGYAVLSVNYRGSTGFGKEHINKGDGEWFGKMQDDLEDAANWAIAQGVTSKDKVGIMGGSYGGYATLAGLTKTPDFYALGIDIVGPSNLVTLLESVPPYWKPIFASLVKKVGASHETEEGREFLLQKSPLTYTEQIKKPLMIVHGANDPRVKQAESDQIVAKMKEHNIPVVYLLYPDEGHGLARPENRLSFYANAEIFLAKFLGGRTQPNDGQYPGSTIQFIEGEVLK